MAMVVVRLPRIVQVLVVVCPRSALALGRHWEGTMRLLVTACAIALACVSCSTPRGAPVSARTGASATALHGDIIMNFTSWGRLDSHWRIRADGSGELWRQRPAANGAPGDTFEKYRGRLPADRRAEFTLMLDRLRSGAIPRPACPNPVHDAPGVDFRWGPARNEGLSFYYGCLDPSSRAYARQISALNAIVLDGFVRDAQPYAVERVESVPDF